MLYKHFWDPALHLSRIPPSQKKKSWRSWSHSATPTGPCTRFQPPWGVFRVEKLESQEWADKDWVLDSIHWVVPPAQDSSHHQDYFFFGRDYFFRGGGGGLIPSFDTVTGRGDNPRYSSPCPSHHSLFTKNSMFFAWRWWWIPPWSGCNNSIAMNSYTSVPFDHISSFEDPPWKVTSYFLCKITGALPSIAMATHGIFLANNKT